MLEHGVFIDEGPSDWEILQRSGGQAAVALSGHWQVPQDAINVGAGVSLPMVRVLSEEDNRQLIPWTKTENAPAADGLSGTWRTALTLPQGGMYRIETGLDTKSTNPAYTGWIFRGDSRFHLGVGDVFVIAGQSNAAGYGRDMAYDPPSMDVHLFRNRRQWDLACHPMNETTGAPVGGNAEMGVPGTSPYLMFGKQYAKLAGCPVGLIETAKGGMPITRWVRGEQADLFENMLDKIRASCPKPAGVLWYQGCSDGDPDNAPQYSRRFHQVVEDLRAELGFEIPFFTVQLNRWVDGAETDAWGQVREAQRLAAHEIPGVYLMTSMSSSIADAIHNSSSANVLLGERLARQVYGTLQGDAIFAPPEIVSAQAAGAEITLELSNVADAMVSFGATPNEAFTLWDGEGQISIKSWAFRENTITLAMEAPVPKGASLSYGWQSNPIRTPVCDNVNYLPLISCHKFPVRLKG